MSDRSPTPTDPAAGGSPTSPQRARRQAPAQGSKPVPAKAPEAPASPPAEHRKGQGPDAAPRNPSRPPEELVEEFDRGGSFLTFAAIPSWLTSLVLHIIAILVLALLSIEISKQDFDNDLTIGKPEIADDDIELFEETVADVNLEAPSADVSITDAPDIPTEDVALADATDMDSAPIDVELSAIGFEAADSSDLMQEIGSFMGSGLEGRGAAERTRLVREAGGTEGSEQAVKRALQWLIRHQNPDGSWSFFHLAGRCNCPGHGELAEARIGATAIALLPFLGAGNTHRVGNYRQQINKGLYFLLNSQKATGSLWENGGTMYSHGLAAIVLCEAYAMTGDKALQRPAQASLEFISYAQDPITRGWRYQPRDMTGGDTSVVGWQLMALKSGHMGNLYVNPSTVAGAKKFLDSVQANDGASYGYMAPGEKSATSAIGLLCRMYLGWNHEHPALQDGVQRLSKSGPSDVNMYYNYYATQVMRHYEGPLWEKWNEKMRDYLVKHQDRRGHREGSWYMGKRHTDKGGRLYCTAMATMILEVYYRHLPIYRKKAAEEDFEL